MNLTSEWRRRKARPDAKLGAFLGVYTPSALTILGVILFLRTGWVVGNIGLQQAVVIGVIAHAVTDPVCPDRRHTRGYAPFL